MADSQSGPGKRIRTESGVLIKNNKYKPVSIYALCILCYYGYNI